MGHSSTTKTSATNYPEFVVTRESFNRYFEKPLPTSTFHDFVNKGKIVPMKGFRGFYLLNASLKRLGLKEVPKLPEEAPSRKEEDILELAFHLIDPEIFRMPSWVLLADELEDRELNHARYMAEAHRPELEAQQDIKLKLAYAEGALQAYADKAAGLFDRSE